MRSGSTTLALFVLSLSAFGCSANVGSSDAAGSTEDGANEEVVSSAPEALHTSPVARKLVGTYTADDARALSLELRTDGTFVRDTGIRCITTPCPSSETGAWNLLRAYTSRGFLGYVVHVAGTETNAFYLTRPTQSPVKLTGLASLRTTGSYTKAQAAPANPCIATLCPSNTRCVASGGDARCESTFACPDATVAPGGFINCMPIVPADKAQLCSGAYHAWIQANCPGIGFTY